MVVRIIRKVEMKKWKYIVSDEDGSLLGTDTFTKDMADACDQGMWSVVDTDTGHNTLTGIG